MGQLRLLRDALCNRTRVFRICRPYALLFRTVAELHEVLCGKKNHRDLPRLVLRSGNDARRAWAG